MTQKQAFEILKLGHNVFLTGSAGSGKTFLLRKYIDFLRDKGVKVGVTAPTGIAATHLEGITIHSWSGIGINKELSGNDLKKILRKKYLQKRFRTIEVLIIDEISMLHSYCLDMVDRVCKAFKQNSLPFGGLQVILSGDFFQLPPVSSGTSQASFVNKSYIWQKMDMKVCYLDEQHRQMDSEFLSILNAIRKNQADDNTSKLLMQRYNQPIKSRTVATKLYTHNADVDAINDLKLAKIKGKERKYSMNANGNKNLVEALKRGCLAPQELILKKNAAVIFVKNNFKKGYVNGTLGKVVGFEKDNQDHPIIETYTGSRIYVRPETWVIEENNCVVAEISQIPLRLAWAITVHKSQGMSLDAAEIDLSRAFVCGMGYVALSRVRTLEGINLLGFNNLALKVDKDVIELDKEFISFSKEIEKSFEKNQI
ncbi:MAG: AAA family ATPase [Candidatus Pacebacteria bacterium]|nr:AAA family ATPase [Candidatus Paceibacterota bacterium]